MLKKDKLKQKYDYFLEQLKQQSKNFLNKSKEFIDKRNKKFFWKSVNFHFNLLKRNITFWLFLSLFFISPIVIIITLASIDTNYVNNYSFLNVTISFASCTLFIFYFVAKLFSESKVNSVDLIFVTKPHKKITIYLSRFLLILGFVFCVNFVQFFLLMIIILSFNLTGNWVLFYFITNIFINPFLSCFVISFLILLAIYFKKIWFSLVSFIFVLFSNVAPIFSRTFSNPIVNLNYSNKNYNSFAKISYIDNENHKSYIVNKINIDSTTKVEKNVYDKINQDPIYLYFIPGEWINSLYSSLASNVIPFVNEENKKQNLSLTKTRYSNTNFQNKVNNFITLRPQDLDPFKLSNDDYEDVIINNLQQINENKDFLKLNDEILISSFIKKINSSANWNQGTLDTKELRTLATLFGISDYTSDLFYYWHYYDILKNKTPNLLKKIETKFNKKLSELLNQLWTDDNSKVNIINLKIFGNIYERYPNSMIINYSATPLESDIDFIQNNLIRFNKNTIGYLDINQNYKELNISILQNLSPSIIDKQTWDKYVEINTMTYKDANELLSKLSNILDNLYLFTLNSNYFNPYQFSLYLTKSTTTFLNYNNLILWLFMLICFLVNGFSIYKFNRLNYKNMEI